MRDLRVEGKSLAPVGVPTPQRKQDTGPQQGGQGRVRWRRYGEGGVEEIGRGACWIFLERQSWKGW